MKHFTRYRLRIEDESHLTTRMELRLTAPGLIAASLGLLTLLFLIAGAIVMLSPLHRMLPGYMKESERAVSEENLLRLDSLREAYAVNQAFIDNYLKVTDVSRPAMPDSSTRTSLANHASNQDSLLSALPRESRFISEMEKKERYNISILAPLAADAIMFSPVSPNGFFTSSSRTSEKGIVITPGDGAILSAADGTVLASYYSPSERGYSVVIQHNRGFVTAYSHLGEPVVATGDAVISGQAIAFDTPPDSKGRRWFGVRMWHNSLPLLPYEYVDSGVADVPTK